MKQKMKRLLLLMFAAFSFLALSAQFSLTREHHLPRPGDRLIKQEVPYQDPGNSGKDILWDLSELKIVDKEYELKYDTLRSNYWVGQENRTLYYYTSQSDTFALCGHENPTTLFTYRKPEIQLVFPFPYGRTASSHFDAAGQYCGRVNIHLAGKTTLTADATGDILLPGGDTLHHVVRIHLHKSLLEHSLPGSSTMRELCDSLCPVLSDDSIDYHLSNDSVVWQIDTWKWYAEGYRYPVLETVRGNVYRHKEPGKGFAGSFYYPPHEQYYALEYDAQNQNQRDGLAVKYENAYNDQSPSRAANRFDDGTISYAYFIDSQGNLQISYTPEETAELQFVLYDFQGRQLSHVKRQSPGQQAGKESLPLHSFPAGEYLLQIICNGKSYGEKIRKQ